MEPIVIIGAGVVFYCVYKAVTDALKDLRREKHTYVVGMPVPVKVRCRDNAYNERYMTSRG